MKPNAQENLKQVKNFYQTIARRDFNAVCGMMGADFEWIEPDVPGLWFRGTHRGPDSILKEVIEPTFEKVAEFHVEPKQFFDVGEQVVVLAQFQGRSKATGKEFRVNTAHVWTLTNGKVVRFQAFHDIPGLSEALGLPGREAQRLAA